MSLLQSPRRSSSDALESSPDLHVGLDRELDLSAERPSMSVVGPGRGPGVLVATIVASSLVLAGIIMLVRAEPSEAVSEPTPAAPVPEVLASPVEPGSELEPASPALAAKPVSAPYLEDGLEDGPADGLVAAREATPPAAIEPVPPLPSDPPASSEITPAAIVPAAIAPSARGPAPASEPIRPSTPAGGGELRLPAPVFDDPAPEPSPSFESALSSTAAPPEVPDSSDSLPGVEEPSIFEPDDDLDQEPEDHEPDDEPGLPSSTNAYDASEALDAMLDEEPAFDGAPALDAPAA